jgi:phage terminase Nu1 subunit (DNA packaging protein)
LYQGFASMVDVAIEQLAGLCGVSSTAVTTLARRGIMIRATGAGARGKFVLEASVRSYCTHLREQASGRKTGDAPAADRSRLVKAQAQAIEPSGGARCLMPG